MVDPFVHVTHSTWNRITRRKEAGNPGTDVAARTRPAIVPTDSLSKEIVGARDVAPKLFLPGCPLYLGKSTSEQRCNIRRHHKAGERDPTQPISRDEASEVGETPNDRVLRERLQFPTL